MRLLGKQISMQQFVAFDATSTRDDTSPLNLRQRKRILCFSYTRIPAALRVQALHHTARVFLLLKLSINRVRARAKLKHNYCHADYWEALNLMREFRAGKVQPLDVIIINLNDVKPIIHLGLTYQGLPDKKYRK